MDTNSIIIIFYLLPMVVCTIFTTKNVVRLLNEGYRLRATGIYKTFLIGMIPVANILIASWHCAMATFDAIADSAELFQKLKRFFGTKKDIEK